MSNAVFSESDNESLEKIQDCCRKYFKEFKDVYPLVKEHINLSTALLASRIIEICEVNDSDKTGKDRSEAIAKFISTLYWGISKIFHNNQRDVQIGLLFKKDKDLNLDICALIGTPENVDQYGIILTEAVLFEAKEIEITCSWKATKVAFTEREGIETTWSEFDDGVVSFAIVAAVRSCNKFNILRL